MIIEKSDDKGDNFYHPRRINSHKYKPFKTMSYSTILLYHINNYPKIGLFERMTQWSDTIDTVVYR